MDDDYRTIYIAKNQISTDLIRNALLNENIPTKTKEPMNAAIMKIYCGSSFFSQEILVKAKDAERAMSIIARLGL